MEQSIYQHPERAVKVSDTERVLSAIGGGTLLGFSLVMDSRLRIPTFLLGVLLLARGLSGYSLLYRMMNVNRAQDRLKDGIRVERAVTINLPIEDVYNFWRNLENLPHFMDNVKMVREYEGRSHWVAEAPLVGSVEWEAVIEEDIPYQKLAWRSLPGSQITNAGVVLFNPAPGDRGTEVRVHLEYQAPGGSLGAVLAKVLGEEPDVQVREDLRRLKRLLETGQVITTKGQSSGRAQAGTRNRHDTVRLEVGK
jgi:uncharacterized membrane protein